MGQGMETTKAARTEALKALCRFIFGEADIGYWASVVEAHDDMALIKERDMRCQLTGAAECKGHWISTATAKRGIQLLTEDDAVRAAPEIITTVLLAKRSAATYGEGWTLDGSDCDVIMQVGLFGEIKYG